MLDGHLNDLFRVDRANRFQCVEMAFCRLDSRRLDQFLHQSGSLPLHDNDGDQEEYDQ